MISVEFARTTYPRVWLPCRTHTSEYLRIVSTRIVGTRLSAMVWGQMTGFLVWWQNRIIVHADRTMRPFRDVVGLQQFDPLHWYFVQLWWSFAIFFNEKEGMVVCWILICLCKVNAVVLSEGFMGVFRNALLNIKFMEICWKSFQLFCIISILIIYKRRLNVVICINYLIHSRISFFYVSSWKEFFPNWIIVLIFSNKKMTIW